MSDDNTRYYLTVHLGDDKITQEVTKEQWIRAERAAGFRPNGEDRGQPATGGWSNGAQSGSITYGDC